MLKRSEDSVWRLARAETWNATWYVPRSAGGDSGSGHLFGRSKRQASKQPPLLSNVILQYSYLTVLTACWDRGRKVTG